MPVFLYRAIDTKGHAHEDQIVAESLVTAREALRKRGLYPVEVRDDRAEPRASPLFALPFQRERFSFSELVGFTRQLATFLNAGIQIVPALSTLIRLSREEPARRVLTRIREAVNEGAALSRAMGNYPRIFPALYVSMIRAGESSGTLGPVLERLADYLELQQNLRRRLAGALAYPALMVTVGGAALFFMLVYVVPNVVQIFRQARQDLPWPTRMLIHVSGFLSAYYGLLLAAGGGAATAAAVWRRTKRGRWFFDRAKLRIPLIGSLLNKRAVSRFGRTLGVLLGAGLPILEAISIAKLVMGNVVLETAVDDAREAVRKGNPLSGALEKSGLFPPLVTDMIGVGEQSGSLDKMLLHVSRHLDQESESTIQAIMSLMEPLLILVMGIVVGFIVVATLLPLFELSQIVR